jgi:hypothetical protein
MDGSQKIFIKDATIKAQLLRYFKLKREIASEDILKLNGHLKIKAIMKIVPFSSMLLLNVTFF